MVDLNISTVACGFKCSGIDLCGAAAFIYFWSLLVNPQLCGNQMEICHSISTNMYSYKKKKKKPGGIKYKVEKFDQHGTVRNWHKKACGPQRRASDRPNIADVRRTLRQTPRTTPVVGMLYPTLSSALFFSRWRKSKQGFHWFSIMLWHSSMKRDITMILSKHKVDTFTKTMQVLSLHRVLILNLYHFSQTRYRSFLDTL